MKAQLATLQLPTSVRQALYRIDNLLGQSLSWPERLEAINSILVDELEVDAVWLLTIKPLPPTACGSIHTPLAVAPTAQVQVIDQAPPTWDSWPVQDSFLWQVLTHKKPYFIDPNFSDGKTDSDLGDVLFGVFNAIPSAVVPLLADNKPVGALIVGSHGLEKSPPPREGKNLLNYLGEHVGANLHNAYLTEQSRRHVNALKTLNLIAHTITSSLDIDEVIQRTMAGINEVLEVEAGSLLLVDEEKDEICFKITLRGENKQITSYRLQMGEGIAGWVIANNRPTISNHPATDKRFSRKIDEAIDFKTRMVLCVPLVVQGKPIGALEVLNKRTGSFNEADQELLVSMAASLGIALKNVNLYDEVHQRARRNEIINQITTAINTAHGLADIGKCIFEHLGYLVTFDHLSLSLLDDARANLQQWLLTEHGSLEYSRSTIPLKRSALEEIVATNKAKIYDDISIFGFDSTRYADHQILLEDGIRSKIALPLTTKKKPYGCLNLGRCKADAYSSHDLYLLEQIAPQLAVAIEKSRMIDVMEQHNIELKRLNHLSEMLVSTTDISLIVDTTLNMLPRLLPGDVHGIIVAGEQGAYLGVVTPFDFVYTDQIIEEIQNSFIELREDSAPLEVIYSQHLAGNMPVSNSWNPVSVSHLPILTRLGTIGIIYLASGRDINLSDEIWRTFSLIASQIAAAIENARLFQQIEQEKARLAAILSSSTNAILVVNRDGRVVLDNPTAWQVMGVEESQGSKLLSESTQNQTLIQLFEQAMQGQESTGEVPLADGRTFFANLSPVRVGNNGVIGSVATMQDVSHFKELNQLKTDFVNSVSHDLRSPLSGILIAAHLLPRIGELNENQLELVETIENRVNGMSRLIDDLLDVGKIEAGIDMDMESCALNSIVDEVTISLKPLANDKHIHLHCELPRSPLFVRANAIRLRQVVHNLVGNALKYTPDGGTVTVKVIQHDGENRIQVSDTGLGIPAADQLHIFEKFYRVRGEHVAGIKGTGLGLAITKSIVEKHNGRIWLESVFGEGSTFTVALPADDAPSQP